MNNRRAELGIAVVGGAQGISAQHLAAYRLVGGNRIIAICDRDREQGLRVAGEHGARFFEDYDAMLDAPGIDVVDVCSPDHLHCEHAVKAAERGYHILCEKPLAMSMDQARSIAEAVEKAGVKFMPAMVMRWRPYHLKLRELIDDGVIGKPVFARYQVKGSFYSYPQDSRYRKKEGLGQFFHNGPHYVDEVCDFLNAEPAEVYATTNSYFLPGDRMETPNHHFASLRMDGGQIAEIEYNQLLVDPPGRSFLHILIVGTRGTLEFKDAEDCGVYLRKGSLLETLAVPHDMNAGDLHFAGEISHFLDCVRNDRQPCISSALALKVLGVCLGAIESAESGKQVLI